MTLGIVNTVADPVCDGVEYYAIVFNDLMVFH